MMARLSATMIDALKDARHAPLTYHVHGWANNGLLGHSTATVEALVGRGMLSVRCKAGIRRTRVFSITPAGAAALEGSDDRPQQ